MNDEQAIRGVVEAWMEASKAGDTAKVLSLMTDDVVFLVPGQKPFGKAQFAAGSESMKGVRIEGSATVEEVEVHGDVAFARTRLVVIVTPPNGSTVRRSGYAMTIFRKQASGAWLLARDANVVTAEPPARAE
jgi:uncharacterized protein (TIGR02246 family)